MREHIPVPRPAAPLEPEECIRPEVQSLGNERVAILRTSTPFPMPDGRHYHNSYEFTMPVLPLRHVLAGAVPTGITVPRGDVLTLSPEVPHGPAIPQEKAQMEAIMVEPDYLYSLGESLFGYGQVDFTPSAQPIPLGLKEYVNLFIEEARVAQPAQEFMLDTLGAQILVILLRGLRSSLPLRKDSRIATATNRIRRAIEFLEDSLDRDYDLKAVAETAGLSPFHFMRVFKAETGKSPYEYLVDLRVEKAKDLLRHGDQPISHICVMAGFGTPTHFSTVFTRKVGMSPTKFRQMTTA